MALLQPSEQSKLRIHELMKTPAEPTEMGCVLVNVKVDGKWNLIMVSSVGVIPPPSSDWMYKQTGFNSTTTFEWTPKTQMRDFERLYPNEPREVQLATNQAIGVIIVRSLNTYVKLYRDDAGRIQGSCCEFDRNECDRSDAYKLLLHDLAMGYDVLLFNDGLNSHETVYNY